ncbi:MAG: PAS-domain containing protein [Alphaproteobacteria bacterium]|nr:PAS-domain containing protein [Alphaproteobacteria bacterium]
MIKNIALFLFIGAVPSIGWASGYFSAFSWASLFLLLGGVFCMLWLTERQNTRTLKHILLTRDDAWALCEGDQIIDRSPFFPGHSLQSFKDFLHPDVFHEVESAINELINKGVCFKIQIHPAKGNAIYAFEGEPLKGKYIFWLQNITESTYLERLNAENSQKKESFLRTLQATLDMLPILIWHRDQDQRITYCNRAYSEVVGATSQVVQHEGIELIPSRTAKILARKALHTNEKQFFEGSAAMAEQDGRHFRICELPNALEKGTLGVAFDISELKNAQKEIQNLVDAHDEVLAHLSTAIAIYDGFGTLQYYNQAYVNLNSFDEEFLKTHPRLDEVLEELRGRRQLPEYADFPAHKKKCLQLLTEQREPIEEMLHLPDERTLRIFSAPHPMGGLLFMIEDVTNYLSLERNNKTLLNSYQATLDNLFEGVVVIGSNNRLEIFNPSFRRLWNFEEGDINIGQHLNQIVEKLKDFFDYQDDWETYKAQFIESITDRVPKAEQLKRRDGMILNFGYFPLPNGSHLISCVDTTDTFHVQQVLQEKNEALETADHLKSEFIESVSHELKSPLNTIIGFTESLKNKYFGELNEKQNNYVEGVLEASTNLLSLVNDILDLASIEAGHLALELSIVKIPELLQNVVKLISKAAEENRQHITIKCNKEINKWVADEGRLKQVLLNLLSNAIKSTSSNGKIIMEANIIQEELIVSVTNRGGGIAFEEQIRMFNTFEQGKDERDAGSGFGLSLVKKLIELHGGRVELGAKANSGTTVSCFLPRLPLEVQAKDQMACLA